ncbi:MAG: hypothetical protein WBL48_01620, partial [Pseudolabrys sp.]
ETEYIDHCPGLGYSLSDAGQYIGTMPAMQSSIPSSDSRFGKKSAIHHGVCARQSMMDGWPATKYP